MLSLRLFSLFCLILSVSSNVINYIFHDANGEAVNECIEKAMEVLMEETCLFFRASGTDEVASVTFIESGHCGWQEANRTVHLGNECISEDVCFELIGRVLNANQPRSHISRHINIHYNCSEKCTTACEHGGEIQDDCSCKCAYGFTGQRCQDLAKLASFTDGSCGVVPADPNGGYVKLSTYPGARPKTTFCQWLVKSEDPWTVIDAELEDLGLDNADISPAQHCNDMLNVYGTNDVHGPIACDGTSNVTHIRSNNNWLLFELRSNPFADATFTGPRIRYSTIQRQPGVRIYSDSMTAGATMYFTISSLFVTILAQLVQ